MIVGVKEIMPLYGYPLSGDPKYDRAQRSRFQMYKNKHPHLFPPCVSRGRWMLDDVKEHLASKPWLKQSQVKSKRRVRNRSRRASALA